MRSLSDETYIMTLRTIVFASFAGDDIFLAGLRMDTFVLEADHALCGL
jgi:hypothetical protein